MKLARLAEIDLLRGISMLAMILIHTTVYYLSDSVSAFLWDYSQFAVAAFIFCSGFLYFNRVKDLGERVMNREGKKLYPLPITLYPFIKRLLRLLIPYYLFLPFFFLVLFIVQRKTLTMSYLLQSTFLTAGVDINWLVLLFVQFTFLMPFLAWLFQKHKSFFWLYVLLAIGSSILFMFYHLPFSWKLIMWLPWSVVLVFSLVISNFILRDDKFFFSHIFSCFFCYFSYIPIC